MKIINYFKENYKTILYGTTFYVAFLLTFFFGQMVNANDGSFGTGLNFKEAIPFFIAILIAYGYFFYVSWKNKFLRFDRKRTIIGAILGVIAIYLILVVTITDYNNDIVINTLEPFKIQPIDRVCSIFDTISMCLFVFSIICIIPNLKGKDFMMRFFCYGLLLFVGMAMLYSFITEMNVYMNLTFGVEFFIKDRESIEYVYSFFEYGNVFGHLIFFGYLAILYLGYSYKKWWLYPIAFWLGSLIVFTGCRGGFICYSFLNLLLFFYFGYYLYTKKKWLGYTFFGFTIAVITWFILECIVIHSIKVPIIENETTVYYGLDYLFNKFMYEFMTDRFSITQNYVACSNIYNLIFGTGIDILDYFPRMNGDFNLHNGILTIGLTGGPLFAISYLAMFIYTFILLFKILKFDKRFFILYLCVLLTSGLYQFSESYPACFPVFGGGVMGMFLVASVHFKVQENKEVAQINQFI